MKRWFYLLYIVSLVGILGNFSAHAGVSAKPAHKKKIKRSLAQRMNVKKMKPVTFPEKVETNEMKSQDYVQFVPSHLENSSSETYVANRFGDVALQKFFDSPQVRNSPMGKTATKVESAMKTEVNLSAPPKDQDLTPKTEHKISFQVLALQAQTKMEYKGWTHATVKHDARAKETGVEISEKILHNKDLVLSHTKTDSEDKSALGVRWSW